MSELEDELFRLRDIINKSMRTMMKYEVPPDYRYEVQLGSDLFPLCFGQGITGINGVRIQWVVPA